MFDNTKLPLTPYQRDLLKKAQEAKQKREGQEAQYYEFLQDAKKSPKLNDWETRFINDLLTGHTNGRITAHSDLTERQLRSAKQIERKIYAIG